MIGFANSGEKEGKVFKLLCIKHKGISYCWNFETKSIGIFTKVPAAIKDCPDEVIAGFLKLLPENE